MNVLGVCLFVAEFAVVVVVVLFDVLMLAVVGTNTIVGNNTVVGTKTVVGTNTLLVGTNTIVGTNIAFAVDAQVVDIFAVDAIDDLLGVALGTNLYGNRDV